MTTQSQKPDISSLRINRETPQNHSSTGRLIKFGVPVLVILVLLFGYWALQGAMGPAIEVETATATLISPAQASAVLTASGYVVAQRKASIASKGTGRLVFLGVEEGDRVKKDQVIARLEDHDVLAALERAKADLEYAKADLRDAELWLERQRSLRETDLTPQADVDAADARHRRVLASIRAAEAAVRAAEVQVENTRIRAPFDGTVLRKDADVGEVVAPFASSANSRGTVVTIADMTSLEVEADVSESNITRISAGQPCEIVLDAYPEHRYQGFVHKIVPTADRAKATVLTKVRFRELDTRVLPEMSAKVNFLSAEIHRSSLESSASKLTVPASSVLRRGDQDVVFLIRNNELVEIPVTTGERMGNRIEITAGLEKGETIVLRALPEMASGTKITAKR
jgi:RND family efflux transporter MFP subunit